jgi:hypothetical protein
MFLEWFKRPFQVQLSRASLEGKQLRFPPPNARLLGPHKASRNQGGHTPLDPPNIVSPERCCSSKAPDEGKRRGCIEHTLGKECGFRFEQRTSFQWI